MGERDHQFLLGNAWPDWWADMVAQNIAVTLNKDDRWRGGPDLALVAVDGRIVIFRKGDLISRVAVTSRQDQPGEAG